MPTPESASSTPGLPIPSEGLIQRIRGSRISEISQGIASRLQALEDRSRVNPEEESLEGEYLKTKLSEGKGGSSGPGGQKVNLKDPDKLWVALNILYPKQAANLAYSVIRSAQITALGGVIDPRWASERIHSELRKSPDDLRLLNQRQILVGEGAVLRLMNEELGSERREEQAESQYTPIRAAALPGAARRERHPFKKIRRFIGLDRPHQLQVPLADSPVEQSPVETAKAETGVPVETQAGSTGEENPLLKVYQDEAAKYGIIMPEGAFMPVDRLEVRSFSGIETIPSGYGVEELGRRLPQVGFFGGNDGTITFVGPDGRYWVGPITDENMQALEASGYKKGSVGNIMNADCTFVDPRLQAEWEGLFSDQPDESLAASVKQPHLPKSARRPAVEEASPAEIQTAALRISDPKEPLDRESCKAIHQGWIGLGHTEEEYRKVFSGAKGNTEGVFRQMAEEILDRVTSTPTLEADPEEAVVQQLYEREGRLKLAIHQQNLSETQEAAAEIAGILDSLDDPVKAARYLSALRPDIKVEILSALSKLPSEKSEIIIEIDEKVTRSWIRFYDETATRVPRPITLDKFNELYEKAEAEISGEEPKD